MTTRRKFLATCGATAAALGIAPSLLIRRARAATSAFGEVEHLVVLYARGGLRSHCLFNAVGNDQVNPFGRQQAASGTEWALGAVCGDEAIDAGALGTLPGFKDITADVTVLGTVDTNPGGPISLDHAPAIRRLTTGEVAGTRTLLGHVLDGHPRYASGVGLDAFPPVDIGNTPFGVTAARQSPLRVAGADIAVPAGAIEKGWETDVRDVLNSEFTTAIPPAFADRPGLLSVQKQNAFAFSQVLSNPVLDVLGNLESESNAFTNQQLLDILGNYDLRDRGDFDSIRSWGPDVAKAIRFLEFGAPVVVVSKDIYDLHGREKRGLPVRAADLARQLAGLNYILKNMVHPKGGAYFDHTLVVVVSEFGRNNTDENGFNSARGSDHLGGEPGPVRNQAVPLMGGALNRAGTAGRLFGATNETIDATGEVFSHRALLSTLLDVAGVDHSSHFPDAPISRLFD